MAQSSKRADDQPVAWTGLCNPRLDIRYRFEDAYGRVHQRFLRHTIHHPDGRVDRVAIFK
jgi:hypothetical protein